MLISLVRHLNLNLLANLVTISFVLLIVRLSLVEYSCILAMRFSEYIVTFYLFRNLNSLEHLLIPHVQLALLLTSFKRVQKIEEVVLSDA
jgi:hypothetical protein